MFLIWCNRMHVEKIYDFVYYLFLFVICVGHALFIYTPELQLFRLFLIFLPFVIFILKYRIKKNNLCLVFLFFFNLYFIYMILLSIRWQYVSIADYFNFVMLIFMTNLFFFLTARDLKKSILIFLTFTSAFLIISFSLALIEILYGYHLPSSRMERDGMLINMPTGFYTNENDFSVVLFMICFLRICIKREFLFKKITFFDFVLIGTCVIIFLITGARLSIISSLLVLFFLLFFRLGFSIKVLFLGICLIFFYKEYSVISKIFSSFFSNKGSNEIRLNLIMTGIESITHYGNFWGYGINQSSYYYENVLQTGKFLGGIINPHCYLIEILLNSGVIFFLGFLICNFYLTFYFYRKKKYLFSIYSLLYFFILMGSSSSLFLWPHYLCFFMLFIVKKSMEKSINYKNVREP